MKTASSDRLAIRGFGLAAGPGQSFGNIQENLAEDDFLIGHASFYDSAFDPQLCVFQETETLSSFEDRAVELCDAAIDDCLSSGAPEAPVTVTVLLPEADAATGMHRERVIEYSARIHEHLVSRLADTGVAVSEWRFANQGQAALGHAITGGDNGPVTGEHLIIGADSFCDKTRLFPAMENGLLLSDKDKWGFVPGEAGGALWLSPQTAAVEERTILGVGVAVEPVPERDEQPSDHRGLSLAIRNAAEGVNPLKAARLLSDMNNGRYRAAELGYAMHRAMGYCLDEDCSLDHVPHVFGECGAAAGFTALGTAFQSEPGTQILTTFSAISGRRAAIFLQI